VIVCKDKQPHYMQL